VGFVAGGGLGGFFYWIFVHNGICAAVCMFVVEVEGLVFYFFPWYSAFFEFNFINLPTLRSFMLKSKSFPLMIWISRDKRIVSREPSRE